MPLKEKDFKRLAFNDYLTGMPNRAYVKYNAQSIMNIIKKNKYASLIFIDVDNFRNVNGNWGYWIGDELIKRVAKILSSFVNGKDMLFHGGVDKFFFLDNSSRNELEITNLVCKMIDSLKGILNIDGYDIYLTVSVGIVIYPRDGENLESLMQNVDVVMSCIKNSGKNNYKFFSKDMEIKIKERVQMEKELRSAIKNKELKLFYQPKIDINTGEIHSLEALLRWDHPEKGFISPAKFIPLAEETGLIIEIGQRVIELACMQNKKWQQMGYRDIPIAVNLSIKQLNENNFLDLIKKALSLSQLNTKWLEFEITESLVMENFKKSKDILYSLKNLGISISLDDFGTGYSSLNYLRNLPIDYIKIDKSFIDDMVPDKKQRFIACSIISLAHGINIKVIAEGVETVEQLNILKDCGCDIIQGYLFSKPINVHDMESLLINKTKFKI